jgi:hypothetical protein
VGRLRRTVGYNIDRFAGAQTKGVSRCGTISRPKFTVGQSYGPDAGIGALEYGEEIYILGSAMETRQVGMDDL